MFDWVILLLLANIVISIYAWRNPRGVITKSSWEIFPPRASVNLAAQCAAGIKQAAEKMVERAVARHHVPPRPLPPRAEPIPHKRRRPSRAKKKNYVWGKPVKYTKGVERV